MEERIAAAERANYYRGWDPRELIDLPIARNIKVVWTNPVSSILLDPYEQGSWEMEESQDDSLPWE
jgi:hypothetical protein